MIWLMCSVMIALWNRSSSGTSMVEAFDGNLTLSSSTLITNAVSGSKDKNVFIASRRQATATSVYFLKERTISKATQTTQPTSVNLLPETTTKPHDNYGIWSEFIIAFKTKEQDAEKGYSQGITKGTFQCHSYEECQRYLENSHCRYSPRYKRRLCSCSENYIRFDDKCFLKVLDGGACNYSIQCITKASICHEGYCRCFSGNDDSCIYTSSKRGNHNLLLPSTVITLVIAFSIALCSISGLLLSRRFIARGRFPYLTQRRTRTISESCAQSIDKPPAYDEAISTSVPTLNLTIEELNQMPPPSYDSVSQSPQPTTCTSN